MFEENSIYHRIGRGILLGAQRKVLRRVPRLSNKRKILIINHEHLQEYAADLWSLLRRDDRLVIRRIDIRRSDSDTRRTGEKPGRLIRAMQAYLVSWDLVITADHPSSIVTKDFCSSRNWPTLRIQHGLMGKKAEGRAYTYSRHAYDGGQILYSCIFAASEYEKRIAVGYDPEFDRIVRVVGSLQDDALIKMQTERTAIRKSMGVREDDKVVFIVSTWGSDCLFRRCGHEIIREARKIIDRYRFVLSIHPLEYRNNPAGRKALESYFKSLSDEGFFIREPGEDWKKYLVASDVVVTDHTALSAHGALIDLPLVYVGIPEGTVDSESPISLLKNIFPHLSDDAGDLEERIEEALQSYPKDRLRAVAGTINSCPGESRRRVISELYGLLELDPPGYQREP